MAQKKQVDNQDFKAFEKRLKRIDPDHNPTAWRKWNTRPRRKLHVPFLKLSLAVMFTYCTLTTTKVVMERELGSAGFDAKVERLANGTDTNRIAAKLLWRDPVMEYVQKKI